MAKDVRHAVIVQPEESQWASIQAIRKEHDKAYERWMPHINLLYPFVPDNKDVIEKIENAIKGIRPFTISLNKFSYFAHSPRSCTMYLDPNPTTELVELQAKLESAFPDCNDLSVRGNGKFAPHLTLGQFNGEAPTKEMIKKLSATWENIQLQVGQVHVIARSGDQPFKIVHSISFERPPEVPASTKRVKIPNEVVDETAIARILDSVADFERLTEAACVFVDMQKIVKQGAGVHLRNVLLDVAKFPNLLVCVISSTVSKQLMVRCSSCERLVGKWTSDLGGKSMVAAQGDFDSIVRKCSEVTLLPIFTLPEQTAQFAMHFNLPNEPTNTQQELTLPTPEESVQSGGDLNEVLDRVKRWMKKMPSLPATKQKLMNATQSLRFVRGTADPDLVVQRMIAQQKLKFCAPCKKFSLTADAYTKRPLSPTADDVEKLAAKTIEWLCRQPRAPATIKALVQQIKSFNTTKEFPFEDVWKALIEQGIVEDVGFLKYNQDVIQVDERVPAPITVSVPAPTRKAEQPVRRQPQQTRHQEHYPFDKTIASSTKQAKPRPITNFDDMGLKDELLRGIYSYGFEYPSQVQQQLIPALLQGKDVVMQSQNGTGKTAAYCIPLLQRLDLYEKKTQALIIVPTREIAQVVHGVIDSLGSYMKVTSHCVVGGASVSADMRALERGVHVVVGTCGRIFDMIKRRALDVSLAMLLVLDEADELLTAEKDALYDVVQELPKDFRTVLVSSTYDEEAEATWNKFMREPLLYLVPRKQMVTGNFTTQCLNLPSESHKLDTLMDFYEHFVNQTLVICNTKRKVDWLTEQLRRKEFTVASIHGDMQQSERDLILREFKTGSSRVLIGTTQLSRGIDVHAVTTVINYDFPATPCEFYHRLGRAGRFGRKGVCVSLVTPEDKERVQSVEQFYGISLTDVEKVGLAFKDMEM